MVQDRLVLTLSLGIVVIITIFLIFSYQHKTPSTVMSMKLTTPSDAAIRLIIGCIIICGFFGVVWAIFYYPIPAAVKDIVLLLIGALIGSFKDVTGFYFGSSSGSVAKDQTIATIASAPDSPPPTPVPPTVKVDTSAGPVPVTEVPPVKAP